MGGLGGGREEGSDWGGVRVDVIEELKFLGKFNKKMFFLGGVCGGGGVGSGGLGWWGGGQGGCQRKIEVFVKIRKKNLGGGGGGGGGGGQGGCDRRI